jgi:hypothetical protein
VISLDNSQSEAGNLPRGPIVHSEDRSSPVTMQAHKVT